MSVAQKHLIVTVSLAGVITTASGSLASAFDSARGWDLLVWASRSSATLAAMGCVLACGKWADDSVKGWSLAITVLLIAAFYPQAVESAGRDAHGDAALVGTVISVVCTLRGSAGHRALATLAAGVACACDWTALVWPLGWAWAARKDRHEREWASLVLVGGIVGTVGGYRWLSGDATVDSLAAVHRDLTILLPVVLLGAVGLAKASERRTPQRDTGRFSPLAGWTTLSLVWLLAAVAGAPVDLRVCALPLMVWVPVAITDLRDMVLTSAGADPGLRRVGYLSCALIAYLSIPGLLHVADGPLIAIYLLAG